MKLKKILKKILVYSTEKEIDLLLEKNKLTGFSVDIDIQSFSDGDTWCNITEVLIDKKNNFITMINGFL